MDTVLKCSCCGAPLDIETAQNKVILCPFCNTKNFVKELELPKNNEDERKVYYYPADRNLKQFEEQCSQLLADEPLVPNDIFKEIDFSKIQQIYIPTWEFNGTYNSFYEYKEGGETKTGSHRNGFLKYSSAYKGECLSDEITELLAAFPFEDSITPEMISINELEANGYSYIQPNLRISSRQKDFSERLKNMVVMEQTRPSTVTKVLSWQIKIEPKENPEHDIIYIPFFIAEFIYKGQKYFIISDAYRGEKIFRKLPEDAERKELLKKSFDGKYTGIGCSCMIIPVALWLLGFIGFWKACLWFIPFAIAGSIFMTIGASKDEKKKKEILEQARRERINNRID